MLAAWLVGWLAGSPLALRYSLATMFAFTAVTHFLPRTRSDLIRMVPPSLRRPALLVTLTGLLELAGAAGLLMPSLAHWSALALIALLAAMFPANFSAAQRNLTIAGRPATPLVIRAPLQLFWIAALWLA